MKARPETAAALTLTARPTPGEAGQRPAKPPTPTA
jgi:hypothetical protein